jgi:hypothetical protein
MMSLPSNDSEICSWCAAKVKTKQLGEYEINWKYEGKRDATKGYYICIRCKNWMENLIQQKTSHTWMVIQARKERPCCGGSNPDG